MIPRRLSLFLPVLLWIWAMPVPADTVTDDPFAVRPLLPGMTAPGFAARRADGTEYLFDPGRLEKPVVLVFYRGGWCPFCNLYLAELRHAEPQLREMGLEVIFVSPDRPEVLYPSLEEPVSYLLLSDSPMAAARAFGVAFRLNPNTLEQYRDYGFDLEAASGETHHELPAPAVFIIGVDSVIRFQYVNPDYKVRLHPDVLLAAARVALDGR